jgi:hypothetical protein
VNKLLEPPPGIVETVQRYECPRCGNSCSCGIPYAAKTALATKYAERNPTASVRAIAEQTGVGRSTAHEAKTRVRTGHLDEAVTTGRDGKSYPATASKPRSSTVERAPAGAAKRQIVGLFLGLDYANRGEVLGKLDQIYRDEGADAT